MTIAGNGRGETSRRRGAEFRRPRQANRELPTRAGLFRRFGDRQRGVYHLQGYMSAINLIVEGSTIYLVDCGTSRDGLRIERFLRGTVKVDLASVRAVLLTHYHPDHAGSAQLLRRRFGIQVWCAPATAQVYQAPAGRLLCLYETLLAHGQANLTGRPFRLLEPPLTIPEDGHLKDGDRLDGAEDWLVLETPGHTDRCLSFYNERTNILMTGDLLINRHGQLRIGPIAYPSLAVQSFGRLRDLPVRLVLPGHGLPVERPDLPRLFDNFERYYPGAIEYYYRLYNRLKDGRSVLSWQNSYLLTRFSKIITGRIRQ